MSKGIPKKEDVQNNPKKELEELKKFLRWCFDMKFYGTHDNYLSETQVATRVSDKAREVSNKLGYEYKV